MSQQNVIDNLLGRSMKSSHKAEIIKDLSSEPIAASSALTFTDVADVSEDQTITIGSTAITIEAAAATENGIVSADDLALADAATSVKEFINGEAPSVDGVSFNNRTFDEPVTATVAAGVVTVTANTAGSTGNLIATAETQTNASWTGSFLTGGNDRVFQAEVAAVASYDMGGLPDVGNGGEIIFVSDAAGDSLTGSLAFSNGTVWIDVTTGAEVTD